MNDYNTLINYILIIIFICILCRYFFYKLSFYINSTTIKSNIDNNYYIVRNNKNKQKSADTLALININILKLIEHLKNEPNQTRNIKLLMSRYNSSSLMENINLENTTYTIDKGAEISVCLSSRDSSENIYDINELMFVIIHELAHVGCESYGHNAEFRVFFIYLLKKSMEINIYTYKDYFNKPIEYCGLTINATPV